MAANRGGRQLRNPEHPEPVLEAGGGGHGQMDDVGLAGGGGEAADLAGQVADLHRSRLRPGRLGHQYHRLA
jgi:hypothetical protein